MTRKTITLEVASEAHAELLRKWAGVLEELDQVADTASDGHVLEVCEEAVIKRSRDSAREALEALVQRRINAAEKKGRPYVSATVVAAKKTAVRISEK